MNAKTVLLTVGVLMAMLVSLPLYGCTWLDDMTNHNKKTKDVQSSYELVDWNISLNITDKNTLEATATSPTGKKVKLDPTRAADGFHVVLPTNPPQVLIIPYGMTGTVTAKGRNLSRHDILTLAWEELDNIAREASSTLLWAGIGVMIIFVPLGMYTDKRLILVGVGLGTVFIAYGYSKVLALSVAVASLVGGAAIVLYRMRDSAVLNTHVVDLQNRIEKLRTENATLLAMVPPEKGEAFTAGKKQEALAAATATKKKGIFRR